MSPEEKDLNRFTWNSKVSPEDVDAMHQLRAKAREFAELIFKLCPACADRSAAIRDLRIALMQANASIAHRELNTQ